MKIMFKLFMSMCSFLFSLNLYSQISANVDIGLVAPVNEDLSSIFDAGLKFSLGPVFQIPNSRLSIRPKGEVDWYFKEIDLDKSISENVRILKVGVGLGYEVIRNDKLNIVSTIGVNYNWTRNYFTQSNYDPFTNTESSSSSENIFEGEGLSYDLGAILFLERVYFRIGYVLYNENMDLNPSLLSEAFGDGFVVEPTTRMNFTSISFSVGYFIEL